MFSTTKLYNATLVCETQEIIRKYQIWVYSMVTLFIHSISFRYIYIQVQKTNYPTKLQQR